MNGKQNKAVFLRPTKFVQKLIKSEAILPNRLHIIKISP